ncbi:MAG TPA: hypothetical protein VH092_10440 [Urbifossiella sp.]|nr:hypothetical protein [Urbifossiella sp.]
MTKRSARTLALAVAAAVWAAGTEAEAQLATAPAASATNTAPQLGLANAMYGSAPLNPYLNPYLMGTSPGNPDFLTYAYLANQRNGGIGSGVISGVHPAPGAPAGPASAAGASKAARNAPYTSRPSVQRGRTTFPTESAMTPGGNTGGYFLRGPSSSANGGSGRFYSRTNPSRNSSR